MIATTTIRISEKSRDILRELASASGTPMQQIVEQAIEAYQRQRWLAEVNAAYAALRAEPDTWQTLQEEQATWDATLMDGLGDLKNDSC